MYEWVPVSILAFLVGLGLVGDTVESGRAEAIRDCLREPHAFPGVAL